MLTYLVTGASGFIGQELCKSLKDKGHTVCALMRKPKPGPWNDIIELDLRGISKKLDYLNQKFKKSEIDTIFHLAGIAHTSLPPKIAHQAYWETHVEATQHLMNLAGANNVKRFVFVSSVKAISPDDEYGISKQAAEKLVLELGEKYGMHVAVIRPALVYGPGVKGNLLSMLRAIDKGWFPPVPENGNKRSLVSVTDLVNAIILASEHPAANGKIYTVTDGKDYSTRQIYDAMRSALGLPSRSFAIPEWVFKFFISKMLRKPSLYDKLLGSSYFCSKNIQSDLQWKPTIEFSTAVPDMIKNYHSTA